MKKLILSLFIFCSAFVSAQISIQQVTGLPAALNSKVDKVTGKSLVADTLSAKIQPHVTNTANPHSTTKAQVGLGNVDNTSDINKPISSATQTALNGKQPTGTYSTDIHSNITALNAVSGTNTGDETLTSVKTKLGAATAVSDGYLKYQDWSIFNDKQPKLNGSGFVKSFSSEITYDANNYEIAFSKNTAFNKNFGTTTGTVLEGRTFGTAANSAVGDFQPIENQRLSTTNSPSFNSITSTVSTGTAPLTVNSTTMVSNLSSEFSDKSASIRPLGGFNANSITNGGVISNFSDVGAWVNAPSSMSYGSIIQFQSARASRNELSFQLAIDDSNFSFRNSDGTNYSAWKKLYHSGNLTNTLSTNYIPKWNGSNFVNALNSNDITPVYQTQTTVNGSTSGNMVCSMPFQTGSYKKVMLYANNMTGTARYYYPTIFVGGPSRRTVVYNGIGTIIHTDTYVEVTASSNSNDRVIIEGY